MRGIMKTYTLKPGQESIEIVDGPFAGRQYEKGRVYAENDIPESERHRFAGIADAQLPPPPSIDVSTEAVVIKMDRGKKPAVKTDEGE